MSTDQEEAERLEIENQLRDDLDEAEERAAGLELVLRDVLAERGESWLFEVVKRREELLEALKHGERLGENYEDCGSCAGVLSEHSRTCPLAHMLRIVGGEEERQRQVDAAHGEALEAMRPAVNVTRPYFTEQAARYLEDRLIAEARRPSAVFDLARNFEPRDLPPREVRVYSAAGREVGRFDVPGDALMATIENTPFVPGSDNPRPPVLPLAEFMALNHARDREPELNPEPSMNCRCSIEPIPPADANFSDDDT